MGFTADQFFTESPRYAEFVFHYAAYVVIFFVILVLFIALFFFRKKIGKHWLLIFFILAAGLVFMSVFVNSIIQIYLGGFGGVTFRHSSAINSQIPGMVGDIKGGSTLSFTRKITCLDECRFGTITDEKTYTLDKVDFNWPTISLGFGTCRGESEEYVVIMESLFDRQINCLQDVATERNTCINTKAKNVCELPVNKDLQCWQDLIEICESEIPATCYSKPNECVGDVIYLDDGESQYSYYYQYTLDDVFQSLQSN